MRKAKAWLVLGGALGAMAAAGTGHAQETSGPPSQLPATTHSGDAAPADQAIVVLGSRIPRVELEGPAPVTGVSAQDILRNGYQSVPDLLRALTQNGGETQSQQSGNGAAFTPGAQQVDLRGLGPNHTLVLVNGRRIADFPLPFNGQSNFTDISNIPVGLIERVEVLSGSASAIYGSDAISGVVNFQLKKSVDGTRIDYRYGDTQHGGGASHRLTLTTGWNAGAFHGVIGVEGLYQKPLWQYQRARQDSVLDDPTGGLARRTFLRTDEYTDYLDPGAATCAGLANLNRGSTIYTSRPRYGADGGPGYFCGSNSSIAYGTMISERKSVNAFGAIGLDLPNGMELFTDFQASYSKVSLMPDVLTWYYETPDGNQEGTFHNTLMPTSLNPTQLDNWYRQFTPEEMGGLRNGMTHNRSISFTVTPGLRGKFGKNQAWAYELSFNHSEYRSKVSFPQVVISKANAFYLGQQQGTDADGYAIFAADPAKFYTPLTQAQYDSITANSIYRPRSYTDNLAFSLTNGNVMALPGGQLGLALVGEYGGQGYDLRPDPKALEHYYVGLTDSDGKGSRRHWALGGEVRVPLAPFLQLSGAARYDHFHVVDNSFGKATWNLGAELRPTSHLLLRGAMGTGFRAPDLHYVFSGNGDTHPSGVDYLTCRRDNPGANYSDCDDDYETDITSHRTGNRALRPETSRSINAGVFWQPDRAFDVSVDYFKVTLENQVLDLSKDELLRRESDCVLGRTTSGSAVDANSPTCRDAIARVQRYASGALEGGLQGVYVNPINVAREQTDGIDVALHWRASKIEGLGFLTFGLGYTYVFHHSFRQYQGDALINKLAFDSGYDIPRDKGTASLTLVSGDFTTTLQGQRLGRLPNYDETAYIEPTTTFNLSAQYKITDHVQVSGTVTNLFDTSPNVDPTYGSYPYYDISWFDGVGRSFYLQLTWKLGGKAL
jgi:outer membrane receptor protein involved in Fe transport